MTIAEPDRLLALFRRWGKNARVRNFLGLTFMTGMIHVATNPASPASQQVIDMELVYQFARLFTVLEGDQIDETPADGVRA